MRRSLFGILLGFAVTLSVLPGSSEAHRITPETECVNQKLQASSALVKCRLRAEVFANRRGQEVSEERILLCEQLFNRRFERAEARAAARGVECPSDGGRDGLRETISAATLDIALAHQPKTLTVEIGPEDLLSQMDKQVNLNISGLVNDTHSIIWRSVSYTELAQQNQFQWSPVYRVFTAPQFQVGAIVQPSIHQMDVPLGYQVTIESSGVIGQPIQEGPNNAISVISKLTSGVLGLSQGITDPTGVGAVLPIFVSREGIQPTQLITPVDKVLLWFAAKETGTQLGSKPVNSFPVDLTETDTATVRFSEGVWSLQ